MSGISVQIDTRSFARQLDQARRQFGKVGDAVDRAAAAALNLAAKRAATGVRRELAAAKGLPQKVIGKRISSYKARPKPGGLAARIWIGIKHGIPITAPSQLKRLNPKPFSQRVGSKEGLWVRRPPSVRASRGRPETAPNLPIEQPKIRLMPEAQPVLERHAQDQARTTLPREFQRMLTYLVQKLRAPKRR